ncbi:thiol-disulfide isomerase/thioredoxin [Bacillus mesophilus]|uniref:TlpA family protein disulfide reductase n=1 Tax=Bacillus mesophilus TaxID=1808955 RepID=A0A6M0QAY6_9BACI|nr:thiol-disulfide isomerase/thioredoxin [Bacillus mesophilus]NEY73561.1 TlpA family protein disulfide reductase [Bacillus mesophilus]
MKRFLAIGILLGLIGYTVYTQVWVNHKEEAVNSSVDAQTNPFNPNEKIGTVINKGDLLNKVAPDFTLETLTGEKVTLSELKGKKVFINFWASWCPPCRDEMPEIQHFFEQHPDVVVLAVDLRNTEKSDEAVEKYITENEYSFPVLLDRTGQVGESYKVLTLPTSYFINTKGEVQYKFIGPLTLEKMKELANTLN